MTKVSAARGDTLPAGISRLAVRGLSASMSLSAQRLKPIAVLRAVTIQMSILMSSNTLKGVSVLVSAKT